MNIHAHVALFSSVLAIGVSGHPHSRSDLGSHQPKRYLKANLRRRSGPTNVLPVLPVNTGNATFETQDGNATLTFDPAFANLEKKDIIGKYSKAADSLNGINLNPEAGPSAGYAPFNDTPIVNHFKSHPNLSHSALHELSTVDSDPILGLPASSGYTNFDVMHLKDDIEGGMDIAYYGPLQFGTPPQELTVSIDTGSADLWIPTACPSCSNAQFAPAASSTYTNTHKRVSVSYGAGKVTGTIAQDVVRLGSLAVDKQRFIAVRTESQDFMDYASSGLIGLAFSSISRMNAPTFFENLMSSKKLATGTFSTHLTRGQEDGSQICFGCYDLTKTTGPVQWLNLTTKTYWTVGMDRLSSGMTQTPLYDLVAAIDTGSSLILISDDIAKAFYDLIPGSKDASVQYGDGFYTFPCAHPVGASLHFSNLPFAIHDSDFNLGKLSDDSEDCVGGIVGVSSEYGLPANLVIVGDVFLKSWYAAFDYGGSRVGFAPSINNRKSNV